MGKPEAGQDPYLDDVGLEKNGNGHDGRRSRRAVIGVVGAGYFAAVFFDIDADGGREAAWFFGTFGFAVTFPILLLLGKLLAALVGKWRKLGAGARTAAIVTPAVLLSGLVAWEGARTRDPRSSSRSSSPPRPRPACGSWQPTATRGSTSVSGRSTS